MSDTLQGVITGGLIGLVSAIATTLLSPFIIERTDRRKRQRACKAEIFYLVSMFFSYYKDHIKMVNQHNWQVRQIDIQREFYHSGKPNSNTELIKHHLESLREGATQYLHSIEISFDKLSDTEGKLLANSAEVSHCFEKHIDKSIKKIVNRIVFLSNNNIEVMDFDTIIATNIKALSKQFADLANDKITIIQKEYEATINSLEEIFKD